MAGTFCPAQLVDRSSRYMHPLRQNFLAPVTRMQVPSAAGIVYTDIPQLF